MKTITKIALSMALLSASSAALALTSNLLAVPQYVQEHSNWCWAGVSQMVLVYKGHNVNQCETANFSFNITNACGNTTFDWNSTINRANDIPGISAILTHWGVLASPADGILSQSYSVQQIDAGHPYVIRWGWTSGGGHVVVAAGYSSSGANLYIKDPWPGLGLYLRSYSSTVSASDRTWTHSIFIN